MKHGASLPTNVSLQSLPPLQFHPNDFTPEPPPCLGCRYAITCRTRQLACKAFAEYAKSGRWMAHLTSRLPSRRPYLRLFRN
jgi:hypothetical protein